MGWALVSTTYSTIIQHSSLLERTEYISSNNHCDNVPMSTVKRFKLISMKRWAIFTITNNNCIVSIVRTMYFGSLIVLQQQEVDIEGSTMNHPHVSYPETSYSWFVLVLVLVLLPVLVQPSPFSVRDTYVCDRFHCDLSHDHQSRCCCLWLLC